MNEYAEIPKVDYETLLKAFKLFANWVEECDFGYDNLPDLWDEYGQRIEDENYDYVEGLIMLAIWETQKEEALGDTE